MRRAEDASCLSGKKIRATRQREMELNLEMKSVWSISVFSGVPPLGGFCSRHARLKAELRRKNQHERTVVTISRRAPSLRKQKGFGATAGATRRRTGCGAQ